MAPKHIPQSKIINHFVTLPDRERVRLLYKHMTPARIRQYGQYEFKGHLDSIKKDPAKLRAFVRQKFGNSPKRLNDAVKQGELFARNFLMDIYRFEDKTDEDKLCALIRDETTMPGRIYAFYDYLTEEDQKAFDRQGVINSKNDPDYIQYSTLSQSSNFLGDSNRAFLNDVLKTMDLSKEKSTMEWLRTGIHKDDPRRTEKLSCAAQRMMIFTEGQIDPEKLAKELQDKNWDKKIDNLESMVSQNRASNLEPQDLLQRIKNAMEEIPETEEEKTIFKEAGLQTCRDYISIESIDDASVAEKPQKKAFLEYSRKLESEMASDALKTEQAKDIRTELAKEYEILKKEKSGWFLSKTNSTEYNDMMRALRIFNAKMDILSGSNPSETLTKEEMDEARNTAPGILLANAKQGIYNYGSIKVKNGKGSIWHDAGTDRFDSSMKSLQKLGELGSTLHLSNTATSLRDETQLQVLQNRGSSKWLKANIEDAFAKSICAQVSLNNRMPDCQQKTALTGAALEEQVGKIKSSAAFRKMVEMTSSEKLADAIIKGGNSLYEVYNEASKEAAKGGHEKNASGIDPANVKPKKDTKGLVPGL